MIEPVTLLIGVCVILAALLVIASTNLLIAKRHYVSLSKQYSRRAEALGRTNMALMAIESNGVVADVPSGMRCKYCNANADNSMHVKHSTDCPVGVAMRTRRAMEAKQ